LEHVLKALQEFNIYFTKLKKVEQNLRSIYSLYNMSCIIMYYEYLIRLGNEGISSIRLMSFLENPCFLLLAYHFLKTKRTEHLNDIPVSYISIRAIKNLAEAIKDNNYIPCPLQRSYILKINGKKRPLAIASTLDKVLQYAIYLILNPLFNKTFSLQSHGFIKGRSCHTALLDIYHRWLGVNWFIEFTINSNFDDFQHSILL
jgi:retron-type reverse transcriptase